MSTRHQRTDFRLARLLTITAVTLGATLPIAPTAQATPPTTPALVAGTPCTTAAQACVDMTAKRAWLVHDGKVTRGPVPIETGGPGQETPAGTFVVQWKDKNHRSAEFNNAPMPYSVFFAEGGIAFHQGTLQRQSAGCVRLKKADAVTFYDTLELGDQVQIIPKSPGARNRTSGPAESGDR